MTMSEEVPQLHQGFAVLLADAMRPHLREEMRVLIEEYMGQNGDVHRKDHRDLREFLDTMRKERTTKQERWEAVRRQLTIWGIISLITMMVTGVWFLAEHWVKTAHQAAVQEQLKKR